MKLGKITIITVVFNDKLHIENTIKSVINQSYSNLEYIIVDGKSTDGTLEILNKYKQYFDCIISEKDKGVYDAMNKGLNAASGDFVLFMNSGDVFFSNDSVERISTHLDYKKWDIIYGDVVAVFPDLGIEGVIKARDVDTINRDIPANHQSIFINTFYHKKRLYDLGFKIAADYDFLAKSYVNGARFLRLNVAISKILAGGISDANRRHTFYEKLNVRKKYFPSGNNLMLYYKDLASYFVSSAVKWILPIRLIKSIYVKKYSKTSF